MATYVVLSNYTQQGLEGFKESTTRRTAAKEVAKSLGGEIKQIYLTTGRYDMVIVVELPDGDAVARMMLRIGMLGNVTTETMLAFEESDVDRIVDSL